MRNLIKNDDNFKIIEQGSYEWKIDSLLNKIYSSCFKIFKEW